jgi:alpha-galactosidase
VYALTDVLELDRERLSFDIPGVNHFVWLTRCEHDGRDVFPLFDAWLDEKSDAYWASCPLNDPLGPKQVDLYRRLGALPIGDTASWGGGSWGWSYHTDARTEAHWRVDPVGGWEQKFEGDRERVELIGELAALAGAPLTPLVPASPSGEVIVPLIESIACDVPRGLIGNVANAGEHVSGLPRDVAVEVPLAVSRTGVEPVPTAPLPDAIVGYAWRDYIAPVELELAALNEGSRSTLLELVLNDPWTKSERQAGDLLDAVLAMPGHEDMREHYR